VKPIASLPPIAAEDGTTVVVNSRWAVQRDTSGQRRYGAQARRGGAAAGAVGARPPQPGDDAGRDDYVDHPRAQPISGVVTNANAARRWLRANLPNLREAEQALDRIVRDGGRIAPIIERVRALARKVEPQKGKLDVNATIEEVMALTEAELRRNSVTPQLRLADGLPSVMGDRIQLQQVLVNLVVNGVEAMSSVSDRPRELTVLSQRARKGVSVEVRDTGTGLDPANRDRLFQSFYTTKPNGTGMGLAMSRSIIEAHGGDLVAAPNTPYGAVFQFVLPV
jgi:C4-dicarboxylate-specific signal transduction histidine kinase